MTNQLGKYFSRKKLLVEMMLQKLVSKNRGVLSEAMEYSLMAGGKRLRPILALLAADTCGKDSKPIIEPACSLEFIHTYSLIHDDLPAMDDDDLRRGKPTSHKKFGEAAAILAGDALLTDAFLVITKYSAHFKPQNVIRAIQLLAEAAGSNGMVFGQMKDTLEAGEWKNKPGKVSAKNLDIIHLNKTAALIKCSLEFGAVLAGADEIQIKALGSYGKKIGLAFQISDDMLDITGDKQLLGKNGSDAKNNKLTYPSIYGIDKSKQKAETLIKGAKRELHRFGTRGLLLSELADFIINREK